MKRFFCLFLILIFISTCFPVFAFADLDSSESFSVSSSQLKELLGLSALYSSGAVIDITGDSGLGSGWLLSFLEDVFSTSFSDPSSEFNKYLDSLNDDGEYKITSNSFFIIVDESGTGSSGSNNKGTLIIPVSVFKELADSIYSYFSSHFVSSDVSSPTPLFISNSFKGIPVYDGSLINGVPYNYSSNSFTATDTSNRTYTYSLGLNNTSDFSQIRVYQNSSYSGAQTIIPGSGYGFVFGDPGNGSSLSLYVYAENSSKYQSGSWFPDGPSVSYRTSIKLDQQFDQSSFDVSFNDEAEK